MDGTLTCAIHDFDAIRSTLGLPAGVPILEAIQRQPPALAEQSRKHLDELEYIIARQATVQPGAQTLLEQLLAGGKQIGILTRNGHGIALATLRSCGLEHYFTPESVISRDCCAPKPDPAGVLRLMQQWSALPGDTAMVGDYLFDLQAGHLAGTLTVHLDVNGNYSWPEITTVGIRSLHELTELM